MNRVTGTIESKKGFYIGDICYVLNDKVYHGVWGKAEYKDGIYKEPSTGFEFAVAGTAYGDGEYEDNEFRRYYVDAGCIGLVPLELVEKDTGGGHLYEGAGTATFEAESGSFKITLPCGKIITIETDEEIDEEDCY